MKYITLITKQKLHEIIYKINNSKYVSLEERIFLNKYSRRLPFLCSMVKEKSLEFF